MKKHILLIDDDSDEVEIFSSSLQLANINHKCTWVQSVDHAMRVLQFLSPDAIFIDFNMPGTNGIDGIRQIRGKEFLQHIPVVLYSNHISDDARSEAIQLGAASCLQKPFCVDDLSRKLKCFFETYGDDDANEEANCDRIHALPFSDDFKRACAENNIIYFHQLLAVTITDLAKTEWITIDMIEEMAAMVKNKTGLVRQMVQSNYA